MTHTSRKSAILITAVTLVGAALQSHALADGLPQPNREALPSCCFTWSGFYYGANAGAAWSESRNIAFTGTDTGTGGFGSEIADGTTPSRIKLDWGTSFSGGAQAGYNWQLQKIIIGVEADLQWLNAYDSFSTVSTNPLRPSITTTVDRELNMLATLRARLGVTLWERSLLYVTGGLGVGDATVRIASSCPNCPDGSGSAPRDVTSQSAGTPTGFVWGAGYEAALGPRVSVKAEYLHFDLGQNQTTVTYDYPTNNTSSMTGKVHDAGDILRIGVNFRLDHSGQTIK